MIPCLILGDSHAVATADAVRRAVGERCAVIAQAGVNSSAILKRTPTIAYRGVVLSAGANDADNPDLADSLDAIRRRIKAVKVVWLMPYNREAAVTVQWVAQRWGDTVIDLAWARARKDGVHCVSYSWVARSVIRAGYVVPLYVAR
jgi:hypothetical protein